jgi:hypothetical protein
MTMNTTISIEDLPQLANNGAFKTYSSIRAAYLHLANELTNKVRGNHAAFRDIDSFGDDFPEHLYRHLLPAIEACATRLGLEHQIFEFSEQDVFEHLIRSSTWLEDRYSTLFGPYFEKREILENSLEYRESRKEGRSRWTGGGFGLTGALSGAAKAGALNIASGLLHSAFNATANAMGKSELDSFRDSYVRSASYMNAVETMFFELVCDLHLTEIALVAQSSDVHIEVFENREKREKSIKVTNNIGKLALAPEDLRKALIKAIDFYPYNPNIFSLWLENFGDANNQLQKLCEDLALINLWELKAHSLSEACRNKTIKTADMLTQRYAFLGMPLDANFSTLEAIIANGGKENPIARPSATIQPQPSVSPAALGIGTAQESHSVAPPSLRSDLSAFSSDKEKNFYVAPNLPEKKIGNFVSKFKYSINPREILVFFDETLFGRGDNGVVITETHVNIGLSFGDVHQINLKDIHSVSIAGMLNKKITLELKTGKPLTFELTQSNKGAEWIHDVLRVLTTQ